MTQNNEKVNNISTMKIENEENKLISDDYNAL